MFQGGECLSLGHLLRTWPPAISVKTTLRFSHRSETSVCTYSVPTCSHIALHHRLHCIQSRTQSNACARTRMALALGKLNLSCAVIGLTFVNRACRQRTGTPKFRGSGCQFPQSQCHPSPRTGIALGTRLHCILSKIKVWKSSPFCASVLLITM